MTHRIIVTAKGTAYSNEKFQETTIFPSHPLTVSENREKRVRGLSIPTEIYRFSLGQYALGVRFMTHYPIRRRCRAQPRVFSEHARLRTSRFTRSRETARETKKLNE